jgi:hypothetical protein
MRTDPALWQRLEKYKIDDPEATFAFSTRLQRENDWTSLFAARAVEEYKRFLYLARVSGHEVTPSQEVDEVWHLHLLYTRSYWNDLCATVLMRPLHHGPTKGGRREDRRYLDNYTATLDAYRHEFREEPPADLWPDAVSRFAPQGRMRRIDLDRNMVLRKPRLPKSWGGRLAIVAAGIAVVLVGPAAAEPKTETAVLGLGVLVGGLLICGIGYAFARLMPQAPRREDERKPENRKGDGSDGGTPVMVTGSPDGKSKTAAGCGSDAGGGGAGCSGGGGCGGS